MDLGRVVRVTRDVWVVLVLVTESHTRGSVVDYVSISHLGIHETNLAAYHFEVVVLFAREDLFGD